MPREQIARITDMGDVFQLERNMVHSHLVTPDEIDRMVIRVAAHEDKKIFNPVRDLESEHTLIEFSNEFWIRYKERDVPELQRSNTDPVPPTTDITPFGK